MLKQVRKSWNGKSTYNDSIDQRVIEYKFTWEHTEVSDDGYIKKPSHCSRTIENWKAISPVS